MDTKQIQLFSKAPESLLTEITVNQPSESQLLREMQGETEPGEFSGDFSPFNDNPDPMQGQPGEMPASNPGQGNTVNLGQLMESRLFVDLIDTILPALMVAILSRYGKRVTKGQLQASEKEKKIIEPIMQKVMEQLNIDAGSPVNALLLALGVIYGSKTIEIISGPGRVEKGPIFEGADSVQNIQQKRGRGRPRKN